MKKIFKIGILTLLIILAAVAADYIVGYRQNNILLEKAALKRKLELLAWQVLRAGIKDVTYQGNKYRLAITYENPFPEEELYVMVSNIRCLVQVGTYWKEVPVHDVPGTSGDSEVVKLTDKMTIEKLVEVPFRNFEQVLPGYMHVRLNTVSYVSSNAVSKDDIVEKDEDFYIYLRPYYADLGTMSRKYTFTRNDVPIFIPMPPH